VYIGSTDGKVYSFGATSGELRWSQSTGGYVYASPAVWKQRILVGSYSGTFYRLDAATGDIEWKFEAGGPISGSASVIGDVVYFSTLKGAPTGSTRRPGSASGASRTASTRRSSPGRAGVPDGLHAALWDGAAA
jgi:outer membrane protein assembly factor BamB